MENLPTLRQLQYLVALDDRRSFQKAAEDCNVTQSTLSGGLRDMEDILRTPVIDRSSRKLVRFTPLGEDVLKSARGMISQMEDIAYRARRVDEPLSWPLKMGVIPTIAPYLLPQLLKPLQKALPKLDLHIHEMRSPQLVEKIHDGTLDFALMAFPFDLKGLREKAILHEDFVCAAPPGSFRGKTKITIDDLKDQKLLLLEDGHCLRDQALDACKLRPAAAMQTFSASSLSTLIQMVHQGYGITLLPRMAVNAQQLPKGLIIRPFAGEVPSRTVGLSWKKGGMREKDIDLVATAIDRLLRVKK